MRRSALMIRIINSVLCFAVGGVLFQIAFIMNEMMDLADLGSRFFFSPKRFLQTFLRRYRLHIYTHTIVRRSLIGNMLTKLSI